MEYAKTIKSGNEIEIFEYELKPLPPQRKLKVADDEKISEEEKFGKRKDNVLQAKRNFKRLVASNLAANKPLLLTLTYKENMEDISVGYADYRLFIQKLRYKFGKDFKYITVPEFQKRGAVHFHALVWGLPSDVSPSVEKETRLINNIWGKGFVFLKKTDGNSKLSSYLAKYMAKAFIDERLKNQKAYVSSRNVTRPIITTNSMITPLLYEYLGENDLPVIDKTYMTRRLGKCRYRLFKVKN